jgi:NAD(P)-dependent dehydrogenase (short-subunit alcohol dehydrogenase family)
MTKQEFAGKVIVVTGGANGLGRGMVELFLEEGASVVVGDIDPAGEELTAQFAGNCRFLPTDVSDAGHVQALCDLAVREFGRLDVMCNNAGVPGAMLRLLEDPLDDFDCVVGVNLRGVMLGTRIAGRYMRESGGGSIINVSSIAGTMASFGVTTYRATKAAVIQFTKTAAIDLAEFGIRVNCLLPGQIETQILMRGFGAGIEPAKTAELEAALREIMQSYQPLKRKGTLRDVANAAAFLASERAAYVTGVVLPVDGGITAGDAHNYLEMMQAARARVLT